MPRASRRRRSSPANRRSSAGPASSAGKSKRSQQPPGRRSPRSGRPPGSAATGRRSRFSPCARNSASAAVNETAAGDVGEVAGAAELERAAGGLDRVLEEPVEVPVGALQAVPPRAAPRPATPSAVFSAGASSSPPIQRSTVSGRSAHRPHLLGRRVGRETAPDSAPSSRATASSRACDASATSSTARSNVSPVLRAAAGTHSPCDELERGLADLVGRRDLGTVAETLDASAHAATLPRRPAQRRVSSRTGPRCHRGRGRRRHSSGRRPGSPNRASSNVAHDDPPPRPGPRAGGRDRPRHQEARSGFGWADAGDPRPRAHRASASERPTGGVGGRGARDRLRRRRP